MMGDDPPYLAVGTDVSAKYKGAFCEAKIRKISRHVKCKVTFKSGLGLAPATIPDDQIRGTLRVGQVVEARPDKDKNTYYEATINRIQDSSMYTVVFDDGDITTLRRSALCLKSGRHFNESETLDQLPLTHPEHFLNPVVGGRRGGRRRAAKNDADKDDSSDEEDTPSQKGKKNNGTHIAPGRVVYVENAEKKKGKDHWFPGLIVSPCAQDTVKIRVKDECLVRSFKDGRYYTVPKKEITEFSKEQHGKWDSISNPLKSALEKAIAYLDKDELPPHWDRDVLFGNEEEEEEEDNNSDIEGLEARQQEENDLFLANLHRFHEEAGTPFTKPPSICNKELDLGKLFKIVNDQGGHDKITNGGQWKNVTMKLGLGNMPSTSTVNLVKKNYKRFLYDFEKSSDPLGMSQQSGSTSKVRTSRSQNRIGIGSSLSSSKEPVRKEESETTLKSLEDNDVKKGSVIEPEGDTASVDSTDTKKSEASSATNEEPRRSRSRQESRSLVRKESSVTAPDDKNTSEGKKKNKKSNNKEKDKEDTSSIKAEPPSPAPSSQGSKKGRGGSRKKKEKEEEDVTKDTPKLDEPLKTEGLSKDIKIQVGDKLSVFYPHGDQQVKYEAKVVEMCPNRGYLVHYTGWNTRYDEWIKRNRVAENLSLRTNYQAKSQGKGPASSTSGSGINKEKEKEKESEDKVESEPVVGKVKSVKKKGRTTPAPSPSLSSTGTRSKSGTVKRKRLSAEFEEPAKKKRNSKKNEKDTTQSESESESSDVEMKPDKTAKSVSSSSTPTQSRVGKSQKERKAIEELTVEAKVVIKDEDDLNLSKPSSADPLEDQPSQPQPTEVVDMAQIRSEMRGLPNIVKSKSASSIPSSSSVPGSQSQSASSSVSVKLDIYDFEEEVTDAPKLKMFSPRSPDKKDDGTAKTITDPVTPSKTQLIDSSKVKDSVIAPAPTQSPSSQSSTLKADLGIPKIITAKTVAAPVVAVPKPSAASPIQTSASKAHGLLSSTTSPAILQTRGLLAVSSTATLSGQRIIGVGSSPVPSISQHRPRPPISAAPSAPVPTVGLTATARAALLEKERVIPVIGSSAGISVPSSVPQSSIVARIPKVTPGKPVLKPKPGIIASGASTQATSVQQETTPAKDVKILPPFQHKVHEIFPHLVQHEKSATGPQSSVIPAQTSDSMPEKISALPYSGKSEKFVGATVLNIPSVKAPTPESSRSEKQKRGPPKDKIASSTQSQPPTTPGTISAPSLTTGTEIQQIQKKIKPEVAKSSVSSYPVQAPKPSLLQKSDLKKDVKAPSSEALIKINDTISNLMQTTDEKPISPGKKKKQEKVVDEKVIQKETKEVKMNQDSPTLKSSDKRSSPIKTHFLKDSTVGQPEKSVCGKQDNLITSKTSVVIHKMKLDPRQAESKFNSDNPKPMDMVTEQRSSTIIIPVEKTSTLDEKCGLSGESHSILQISKLSATVESSTVLTQSSSSSSKLLIGKTNETGTIPAAISPQADKLPVVQLCTEETVTKPPKTDLHSDFLKSLPEVHLTRIKMESSPVKEITESKEIDSYKTSFSSIIAKESTSSLESARTLKGDSSLSSPKLATASNQVDSVISAKDGKIDGERSSDVVLVKNEEDIETIATEEDDYDSKRKERPLTPSFLTAKEELAPDFEDEPVLPKQRSSRRESAAGQKFSDSSKEDESCSSLLCEEEIPGSPTNDDEGRSKFDFVDDDDSKLEKPSLRDPSRAEKTARADASAKEFKVERKTNRRDFTSDEALSAMDKEFHGSQEHSSPSTPESVSMSVETGGSPNIDGRGISRSGGGSSKSKESTDGESHSGDGSKSYFEDALKKTSSPACKRTKESRSRLSSPPPKRRRIPRKKSPEEVSRACHRGRGSSTRKMQPGSETPEAARIPLPPPPPFAPLVRPQVQSKWEHLIPNLDGVTDSEERALIIYNCMMKAKEKYLEIRAQEQARERRLKRLRRKERERAAAEKQALKAQEVRVAQ